MGDELKFRHVAVHDDLDAIALMLGRTGVFTAREIVVAQELIIDRIERGEHSEYHFVFAEAGGKVAGYVCYGPITITADRWDVYWIATEPSLERRGIGRALMQEAERMMLRRRCAVVFVETSSREVYAKSRAFYERCGYKLAAIVGDYYSDGDSKVIYSKRLG